MFLVDTDVLSALRRPHVADPAVVAWSAETDGEDMYISAMTVFELELGVRRCERKDAIQGEILRTWLSRNLLPKFQDRILPMDAAVAQRCAALHIPDPRPQRDGFIAATALVHGLIVVTRNVRDYTPMGVRFFNPWEIANPDPER